MRYRRHTELQQPAPYITTGEDLLAELGINVGRELHNRPEYYEQTPDNLLYSTMVTRWFTIHSGWARSAWLVAQKYPAADRFIYQNGEDSKATCRHYIETFPNGTTMNVAAAIGRQLVVRHVDRTPDKYLRWPMEVQGMLWVKADRPDGTAKFVIGESARLDFSASNAPILSDNEKSVTLTSFDPNPNERNSLEIDDYQVFVKLPAGFERTRGN